MARRSDSRSRSGNVTAGRDISGQVANVSGHNNTVIQHQEKQDEPLSLGPDSEYNLLVSLAKRVFELVGADVYPKLFLGLAGLSGGGAILTYLLDSLANLWLIGVLAVVFLLSILMYKIPGHSTCRECGKQFAIYEVDRELKNRKEVGKYIIQNELVFEQCKYCGHETDYIDVSKELIED